MTVELADGDHFQRCQAVVRGLAYRMLGSLHEAEDIVQETWLRWQRSDQRQIRNPEAYLARTASNLCLDRLKAAHTRRETYVGAWLPDPVVDAAALYHPSAEATTELSQDLSYAFMLALERLSGAERVAFLLHDVFDYSFAEIAAMLQREEAACRQLASRARTAIKASKHERTLDPEQAKPLALAFAAALQAGDLAQLTALIAREATFISDGGGKVAAVPEPLTGGARIAKVLLGFAKLYRDPSKLHVRYAVINGLAGFVIADAHEATIQTIAFECDATARIRAIYVVRNPDKLEHVTAGAPA